MPFSISFGNQILDHILGNAILAQPTGLWIALSTADPLSDGSGLSEPVGNAYVRVQCNNWDAAVNRETKNSIVIDFPEATGNWGEITHFAIMDAETGGNFVFGGALNNSKSIDVGVDSKFAVGDFAISISSGGMSDYLANAILDHVFMNSVFTAPTNLYVFFATAAISDSDTGADITEPANTYARQNVNAWDAAANKASQNTSYFSFPEATASWGSLVATGIADALTGGNILFYGATATAHNIANKDTAEFNAGDFDITLTNF